MNQSINLNSMFGEFNKTYGYEPVEFNSRNLKNSVKLISDEVVETLVEADAQELNQVNAAKELTDILYITMQQMSAMGLDINACLGEVHRSNLSKTIDLNEADIYLAEAQARYPEAYVAKVKMDTGEERGVLYCGKTGKVIKPSCYSAADMSKVINK